MSTYDLRKQRMADAMAMREPDRVPICPPVQTYPILHAGYTMAEVNYDIDKGIDAHIKYVLEYEPDAAPNMGHLTMGQGPIMELERPKSSEWAGQPGGKVPDDSIHQFIEFPILMEEEMDFMLRDHSGWMMDKAVSRVTGLLEPFAQLGLSRMMPNMASGSFGAFFSRPDVIDMIAKYQEIHRLNGLRMEKLSAGQQKLEELGFPSWSGGGGLCPFDMYSDFYRGTIDTMMDLYENRDVIERFCETQITYTLDNIEKMGPFSQGKQMFVALHKGMDKFLNDEQYENLYWKYLRQMIMKMIEVGGIPYIYTEGPYNTRLKFLKDVPKGKVVYHFETVDMAEAKRVVGEVACISGGFPIYLLHYGTKQEVIDECKRLIDICAPGGGFYFATSAGFDNAIPENVEAMFDTVKTYGKK